jgi:hypothetical protein
MIVWSALTFAFGHVAWLTSVFRYVALSTSGWCIRWWLSDGISG